MIILRICAYTILSLAITLVPCRAGAAYEYLWEGFEREINWQADTGSAATGRQIDTSYASEGEHSLRLAFKSTAESSEAYYEYGDFMDWSQYGALIFDIYNPTELENIRLSVEIVSGDRWLAHEYEVPALKQGWNRDVRVELREAVFFSEASNYEAQGYLVERSKIRELKFVIYPGEAAEGHLFLDNIRLEQRGIVSYGSFAVNNTTDLTASFGEIDYWPPGLRQRKRDFYPLESFEGGAPWVDWSGEVSVEVSSNYTSHGGTSLMVTFPTMPDGFELECVGMESKLSGAGQLRLDVYNPGRGVEMEFYLEDSDGNGYSGGWRVVGHGWNTLIVDFANPNGWSPALHRAVLDDLAYVSITIYAYQPGRLYFDGLSVGELALKGAAMAGTRFKASYQPNRRAEISASYRLEDVYYGCDFGDARNAGHEAYLESARGRFDLGQFRTALLYRHEVTSFDNPIHGLVQPWALSWNIAGIEAAGRLGEYETQYLLASRLEYERYNSSLPTGLGPDNVFGVRVRRELGEDTRLGATYVNHGSRYGEGVAYEPPRIQTWEMDVDSYFEGEGTSLSLAVEAGVSEGIPREEEVDVDHGDRYYFATETEPAWGRLSLFHEYDLFGYYYDTEFIGQGHWSGNYGGIGVGLEDWWIFSRLSDLPLYDGSFANDLNFRWRVNRWTTRESYTHEETQERKPQGEGKGTNVRLRNDDRARPHFSIFYGYFEDDGRWWATHAHQEDVYLKAPVVREVFVAFSAGWWQGREWDPDAGTRGNNRSGNYTLSLEKYFKSNLHLKASGTWRRSRSAWEGEDEEVTRYFKWNFDARQSLGADTVISCHYGYAALLGWDFGQQETPNIFTLKAESYF